MKEKSFVEASKDNRKGSPSHSDQVADHIAPELADLESVDLAHARASNKPVRALHCLLTKGDVRSFQYEQLDSDSLFRKTPVGHLIVLHFGGVKLVQVTIRGRNLWRLYDYLHQQRMPWIRLADRDFAGEKEPIITAIEIDESV